MGFKYSGDKRPSPNKQHFFPKKERPAGVTRKGGGKNKNHEVAGTGKKPTTTAATGKYVRQSTWRAVGSRNFKKHRGNETIKKTDLRTDEKSQKANEGNGGKRLFGGGGATPAHDCKTGGSTLR